MKSSLGQLTLITTSLFAHRFISEMSTAGGSTQAEMGEATQSFSLFYHKLVIFRVSSDGAAGRRLLAVVDSASWQLLLLPCSQKTSDQLGAPGKMKNAALPRCECASLSGLRQLNASLPVGQCRRQLGQSSPFIIFSPFFSISVIYIWIPAPSLLGELGQPVRNPACTCCLLAGSHMAALQQPPFQSKSASMAPSPPQPYRFTLTFPASFVMRSCGTRSLVWLGRRLCYRGLTHRAAAAGVSVMSVDVRSLCL